MLLILPVHHFSDGHALFMRCVIASMAVVPVGELLLHHGIRRSILILFLILIDYVAGLIIEPAAGRKRWLLGVSPAANIGVLRF
jgi:hypothetical protein